MTAKGPVVWVVDDDGAVRKLIARILEVSGYGVRVFASAEEFLCTAIPPAAEGCLVVDLHLPGLDGLSLQERLLQESAHLPIIFISGQGDIPTTVQAMKNGAVDFLPKPVSPDALLSAVRSAVDRSRAESAGRAELARLQNDWAALTNRQREVLALVAAGKMNKQIADELGIAEKTVKIHRGHAMRKLQVESIAELVRFHEKIRSTANR